MVILKGVKMKRVSMKQLPASEYLSFLNNFDTISPKNDMIYSIYSLLHRIVYLPPKSLFMVKSLSQICD